MGQMFPDGPDKSLQERSSPGYDQIGYDQRKAADANDQRIEEEEEAVRAERDRDFRCKLYPKPKGADYVFGEDTDTNILKPLIDRGALVFPFTPVVTYSGTVDYESYDFTHTNYKYNTFTKAYPSEITLTGTFTAQTTSEAAYMLAAMHFLRATTKSYFGAQGPSSSDATKSKSGTPPPILLFDYLGQYMFQKVPVIITQFTYTLESDVDYVLVVGRDTRVPTQIEITVTLETQYNTKVLRDNFDLDKFRSGELLNKGFI